MLEVYLENYPTPVVPTGPSVVTTDGRRLMVQRRLPSGELALPSPYMIRGVAWSPASLGTTSDRWDRQAEFGPSYRLDLQMIREMNANTVYVLLDFGLGEDALDLLDYLYLNGLMAVVTVDWDGTFDLARLSQVVTAYQQHPAVLCWAVGNEWNINLYHGHFSTLMEAALGTQQLAATIHSLDESHPVASIYGEIEILPDQPLSLTGQIVSQVCPAVDLWGCNLYRGPSFGNFFQQWASISTKPVFLSEYGADSFFSTGWWPVQGYVDEASQAEFNHGLWSEIAGQLSCCDTAGVCLGGTVFEWCDEWWKTGSPLLHEPDGYETWWNPGAFPDGFANEEYLGLVNLDGTAKASFARFQQDYATGPVGPCGVEPLIGAAGSTAPPLRLSWRDNPRMVAPGHVAELELTLADDEWVDVSVVDVQGRRVCALLNGALKSGFWSIQWDGRDARGRIVPAGLYLVLAVSSSGRTALRVPVLH
jgi:hypothetical protein